MIVQNPSKAVHLGRVDFRGDRRIFGILPEDRFSHLYILGKTGTGKSTLLENMAIQDLEHGNGFALIDPHGELAGRIAARVPKSRQSDVAYLDASDPSQPYGYNPLRHVREDRIALATSGFLEVFKKMWPEAWGVRMEHILRNILMALLERPDSTMHDIVRVITDQKFRTQVARSIRNESVKRFFDKEYGGFSFGYRSDDPRFHPHFTLGRIKSDRGAGCDLTELLRRLQGWSAGSFPVVEVVTFASTLGPGGAAYAPLGRARLRGEKSESSP